MSRRALLVPYFSFFVDDVLGRIFLRSDMEIKRVMSMDQSVFQDFLKERVNELQHATNVIASTIVDDPKKKGNDPT